eukprot:CAMPEP_0119306036 /NCGR_PEP_ID=MMETSP1333-20130426/6875_1 /TAXON_ID=418940 /ORGANISM="Scyphosphaera apsteinii, Strain RCC1455" /LENGTH=531 /DNA_ID=CAMNT_0007309245 /DNA_START=99 /DNA_END=1690 /DNA_ORIENTATION=-
MPDHPSKQPQFSTQRSKVQGKPVSRTKQVHQKFMEGPAGQRAKLQIDRARNPYLLVEHGENLKPDFKEFKPKTINGRAYATTPLDMDEHADDIRGGRLFTTEALVQERKQPTQKSSKSKAPRAPPDMADQPGSRLHKRTNNKMAKDFDSLCEQIRKASEPWRMYLHNATSAKNSMASLTRQDAKLPGKRVHEATDGNAGRQVVGRELYAKASDTIETAKDDGQPTVGDDEGLARKNRTVGDDEGLARKNRFAKDVEGEVSAGLVGHEATAIDADAESSCSASLDDGFPEARVNKIRATECEYGREVINEELEKVTGNVPGKARCNVPGETTRDVQGKAVSEMLDEATNEVLSELLGNMAAEAICNVQSELTGSVEATGEVLDAATGEVTDAAMGKLPGEAGRESLEHCSAAGKAGAASTAKAYAEPRIELTTEQAGTRAIERSIPTPCRQARPHATGISTRATSRRHGGDTDQSACCLTDCNAESSSRTSHDPTDDLGDPHLSVIDAPSAANGAFYRHIKPNVPSANAPAT